ncbi:MAG TPA: DUF4112 domain-containing protein [Blastocatellia bacterium]|nr:DUF4112 domain-containing protein [Blastocatellia bacterium]
MSEEGSRHVDTHLERISYLLDRSIRVPGTKFRFGLDPIISLLFPVVGDAITAIVSAYIILVSVRYGLPKIVVARMVFNVIADFVIGSIPLIGDAFDFAWKANEKNMELLNRYASASKRSFWSDWAWVFVLIGILLLMILGLGVLAYYSLKAFGFRLI